MTAAATSLTALREHIVTANYPKAAETFCALLKDGQPLDRLVREAIETTAPFVQAPSHVMTKPDGTTRGVNYDHTVLGWRASLRLMPALPEPANLLPVAQAIWYVPQGLDVWSQTSRPWGTYQMAWAMGRRLAGPARLGTRFQEARQPRTVWS